MKIEDATKLLEIANAVLYMRAYADRTSDHWDRDEDSKVGKRLLALAGKLPGYDRQLDDVDVLIEKLVVECDAIIQEVL